MITMITSLVFGVFILLSFWLGLYYGSKIKNDEHIEKPSIRRTIDARKEYRSNQREQEIMNTNMKNIDNYNGSGIGQEDIPR